MICDELGLPIVYVVVDYRGNVAGVWYDETEASDHQEVLKVRGLQYKVEPHSIGRGRHDPNLLAELKTTEWWRTKMLPQRENGE